MKKLIFAVLSVLLLLAFMRANLLRLDYTRSMPETAQVQGGRTIPMNVFYGKIVYVTIDEERKLYGAYILTGLIGLCYYCTFRFMK